MKFLFISLIIFSSINFCFSQSIQKVKSKNETFDLDAALNKGYKDELDKKTTASYHIKFNYDMKPYLEISFANKSKIKKSSTILFKIEYYIDNIGFIESKTIYKTIAPNSIAKFPLKLTDDELRSYRQPSDFMVKSLRLISIRYSDGSVSNFNFFSLVSI